MCDLVRDCFSRGRGAVCGSSAACKVNTGVIAMLRSYLWERWLSITSCGFLFPFSISHPLLSSEINHWLYITTLFVLFQHQTPHLVVNCIFEQNWSTSYGHYA